MIICPRAAVILRAPKRCGAAGFLDKSSTSEIKQQDKFENSLVQDSDDEMQDGHERDFRTVARERKEEGCRGGDRRVECLELICSKFSKLIGRGRNVPTYQQRFGHIR